MTKRTVFVIVLFLLLIGLIAGIFYVVQQIFTPAPIVSTPTALPLPTFITPTPSSVPRETIFYVSPGGNDSNPGTFNQPWLTVQYAVDHAIPGDVIFLRSGKYNEHVKITHPGQPGRPITLAKYDQETIIIDGGIEPAVTGTADHWTIKDLILHSSADRTLVIRATFWKVIQNKIIGAVYIWGNNNLLEYNDVDGSQHKGNENGIMDDGPNSFNNLFKGNTIHDFYSRGIWSQWLTHDDTIEKNYVYNITGETGICIDLDAASNVGYRHSIRGNVVNNCGQTGIELENSYASVVERNIVSNTKLEGIQIIAYKGCQVGGEQNQYGSSTGDCRGDPLNVLVQQNILYNAGRVGGIVSYEAAGVRVYNNMVYGSAVGLYLKGTSQTTHSWDVQGNIFSNNIRAEISLADLTSLSSDQFNLFHHPGDDHHYELRSGQSIFYSLPDWQMRFGLGQNSIEGDPRFADPAANDFRLQADSPALGSGVDLGIQIDFEGNPNPLDAGYDIGPYYRVENR